MPAKNQASPRKNARRYDSDDVASKGTIISSRVSDPMLERIEAAMPLLGCDKRSQVINEALILFLIDLPRIVELFDQAGVIKKDETALKAFMALPPSPEEIEYMRQRYPEKMVGEIAAYKQETLQKLRELEERLRAVERTQQKQKLETPAITEPMTTDLELQ
jgi:DNA-binding transcriptional MerR regulator